MAEVVVIGAGMGGLASALALASHGHAVTVVEAESRAGGKAGVVKVDGVEMDTGPSLLTLAHVFDELFQMAGTSLRDEVGLRPLSPAFDYRWPDGTQLVTGHRYVETRAAVRDTFGSQAAEDLDGFARHAKQIWDAAWPTFVAAEAPRYSTLFKPSRWLSMSKIDPLRTMKDAIDGRIRSPHLRDVMYRYATYNGSDPRHSPATLCCIAHVDLEEGGYGVEGGIAALVAALVRVAERLGVMFRYDSRVVGIDVRGGRARGVELADGAMLSADAVVANADVAHVHRALLSPSASSKAGLAHGEPPSMSAWNAILKKHGDPLAPHTVLFPRDYVQEFADIFDHGRAPSDPTVYLCAQGAAHQRAGWPDAEAVFLMANAPAEPERGTSDAASWDRMRETVLDKLRSAGLMQEGDELVWERTPIDLAARFPGSRGALYGAASTSRTAAFKRPANRVRGVPGLYLASGSAHPGGGMPLCALSGRAAATAIVEDLGGSMRGGGGRFARAV
ncbi:MAG: phytoene desaturase family protein [Sandaracinaceae bacterium]